MSLITCSLIQPQTTERQRIGDGTVLDRCKMSAHLRFRRPGTATCCSSCVTTAKFAGFRARVRQRLCDIRPRLTNGTVPSPSPLRTPARCKQRVFHSL